MVVAKAVENRKIDAVVAVIAPENSIFLLFLLL